MPNLFIKKSNAPLRIITLSGTEGVTKNLTLFECGDDIIAVDCGIGFPDSDMLGVDVVIPDMTYLVENAHKLRGLFLTHGHEDHIGAVPYFLDSFPDVPIFCGRLVQGFITEKLGEKKYKKQKESIRFHILEEDTPEVSVGVFGVSAFRVNHSVPSATGFAIRTPQGLALHCPDYKIDWTPVLDKPMDLAKIVRYGEEGVMCLLSDCLGSTSEGYSKSERTLDNTFSDFFENAEDRQIFVTTISTNISRMYQIITSALRHGRRVVLSGRSIRQSVSVARSLGYLPFKDDAFVEEEDSGKYLQKDLVYIIAGCYGQQGSSLDRLARAEHKNMTLELNSLVIFSADPNPPGVQEDVERVMDNLTLSGAEVIYSEIQENLHVSGHGPKGDLTIMAMLSRPRYFIPIGGTVTKMRAYKEMVKTLGFKGDNVFELLEGDSVVFENGDARKGDHVNVTQVLVDGSNSEGISPVVIKDRGQLSDDGVFIAVVPVSKDTNKVIGKVEIITRGFVYVKTSKTLIGKSRDVINRVLDSKQGQIDDWNVVRNRIKKELENYLFRETRREPMIIVQAIYI
ncbi:MAG: ribonuclease J [Patescibacteria group bacterium]